MPTTKRALTPQERDKRRAEQRELVLASIEQLRTSDGWQAYLKARRRFSSYSWRNVLLILFQHPTATRVAGFRAWLELGYCVTKGNTGIRIWARYEPSRKRIQAWRDAGADPGQRPRASYKLVSEFAPRSGRAAPAAAKPAPLTAPIAEISGDSHHTCSAASPSSLASWATPSRMRHRPCRRDVQPQTHEIKIAERLSPNGRLVAGIHEPFHALVGADHQAPKLSYAQEELVVESIVFSPCQAQSPELAGSGRR